MNCSSKIVVFDLDETLGYFVEFGMFYDALKYYYKNITSKTAHIPVFNQVLFNKLLDLYPEFIRPNIVNILNYLKKKKNDKHCNKLMIYTNNQGPPEWAQHIKGYFEDKVKFVLFDQIIGAFKVNGQHYELLRTSHMKKHEDLISCTKIPETTQICFIDDVFHPGMNNDNVYYIHIKPYTYDLPFETIVDRFLASNIVEILDPTSMKDVILKRMNKYAYTYVEKMNVEHEIDIMLSKKILQHLHTFFDQKPNNRTAKNRGHRQNENKKLKNKTVRNRI